MSLRVRPVTLREANDFVAQHHRHHKPTQGMKFAIGAWDGEAMVGAVIVSRPVARMVDARRVAEVTRLVTTGARNACSILYAAAARACAAMGYERVQTYILDTEPGTSLKAAGWAYDGVAGGGDWNRANGTGSHSSPRRVDQPMQKKHRYVKAL